MPRGYTLSEKIPVFFKFNSVRLNLFFRIRKQSIKDLVKEYAFNVFRFLVTIKISQNFDFTYDTNIAILW